MISRLLKCMPVLAAVVFSGCLTLIDEGAIGEQRAESDALKSEVYRLRDQVTEMRQVLSKMEEELQSVRNSRNAETKDYKSRLDDIDRNLKTVEASHDQLKKEIVDELARKIEKLPGLTGVPSDKPQGKGHSPKLEGKKKETGYEHIVKPGETLSAISAAYNVTPANIIKANNLRNPSSIRVGQKLFIPE